MTTQQLALTTQDVANRFFYLAEKGQFNQILDELFSEYANSIEPENSTFYLRSVQGYDHILEKAKMWNSNVIEMHSAYATQPIVAGDYFVCNMGMDLTLKHLGRKILDELAVYKVKNGQIVSEQFFY